MPQPQPGNTRNISTEEMIQKTGSDLSKLDEAVARLGDVGPAALDRIAMIMTTASAADVSKASFNLGMVYEALRPVRERATLLANRARLLKQLKQLESQNSGESLSGNSGVAP